MEYGEIIVYFLRSAHMSLGDVWTLPRYKFVYLLPKGDHNKLLAPFEIVF